MKWESIFSATILRRGQEYQKRGAVRGLTEEDGIYSAHVWGSRLYDVQIQLRPNGIPKSMSCSCPYAKDGKSCKHMAAVLYEIKSEEDAQYVSKQVFPFVSPENKNKDYHFFDIGKITSRFVFLSGEVEEAKQMVADRVVTLKNVDIRFIHDYRFHGLVGFARGQVNEEGRQTELSLLFGNDTVYFAECRATGCYTVFDNSYLSVKYEQELKDCLCVHQIALLLLLAEYLEHYNPGDATDEDAIFLLESYRNHHPYHTEETKLAPKKVYLEPKLMWDRYNMYVSFRIGSDRLYVVKSIPDMVKRVEGKEVMKLGKKGQMDFALDCFEEKSQKLYDFVRKCVREEQFRNHNSRSYWNAPFGTGETIKGELKLYGGRLDEFFELEKGKELPIKEYYDEEKVVLSEGKPDLKFTITSDVDEDGVFHGICVEGELPDLMEGDRYFYSYEGGYLTRMNEEANEILRMLTSMGQNKLVSFHVGRRNLAEFYYRVLPKLKQQVQIEEKEEEYIREFLAPEVEFHFRLDAEDNNVFCEVRAMYGELEYRLHTFEQEDTAYSMTRDVLRELEIEECVRTFFPEVDLEHGVYHCRGDEDLVYQVLNFGVDELMRLGEVEATDRFRRLKIRRKPQVSVGVSMENGLLDLKISSENMDAQELLDVLKSYRHKKKYHRLKNGDFLNLENESIEELAAMFDTLHISPKEFVKGKMQIPAYRALYLDKMLEENEEIYAQRDRHFKNMIRNFKTVKDSDFEIPESLENVMRGYQRYGYKWLRTVEQCGFGGILADDMGLGKTLQMISVLLAAKEENKGGTSLVVTPASLVFNWQAEFSQFAPGLNVCTVTGTQAERQKKVSGYENWDVLVTSYDLLKRDIDCYEGKTFRFQVIDEAQYIKNHTTAAAKAVKAVRSEHRFALTGTPIENRLSELWSIFDYLMPGFLYGYETFRKEMELPITKNKDEEQTARLKRMVSPFILRRLKEEVLKDLPEKLEETRFAKFAKHQQELYDGQVVYMREMLAKQDEDDFRKNKLQVLAELTRIRQICCDPALCLENYHGESAKREACMELIHTAIDGEHKMLVFSQFTTMLELLEADLKKDKIAYYKITGATPKEKRLEYVQQFNEDDTPVFLVSLKAGGTGLNLIGADIVIHYDPWWNLAVQNQATDRAHRIGQTKKVSVYKLIVKDTIEEKIVRMQEQKKDLADEILSGETGGLIQMTKEDLLGLL